MADRRLIALKIYFFSFFGGFACLLPYLSVYLRQLGVLSYQVGIISGSQPFLTFLLKPILGAASDKFDKHKQILILCLSLSYSLMFCTLFVPPVSSGEPVIGKDCFLCEARCGNSTSTELLYQERDLCNCTAPQIENGDDNMTLQIRCLTNTSCFLCPCNTTGQGCDAKQSTERNIGTTTFWMLLILLVPAQAFFNTSNSQADAHAMHILGDKASDYGKQRWWGAVGWGLVSVIAGFAMDRFSDGKNQDKTDYSITFYMFAGFAAVTLLTVTCGFDKWQQKRPQKMLKSLQKLLKKPKELFFLVVMFVTGASYGAIVNFLFWYLKDLGGSQLLLGLALMANCVAEIPIFFFSGKVIHTISHKRIFQLALFCYFIRFMSYSLIPSPWWVLMIEPLHGITFGAMYSAAITYASLIAPPGMETTVQGIVGAVYYGVGRASGALLGGALFHTYGGVVMFRVYSVICLVTCILHWFVHRFLGVEANEGHQQDQESEELEPGAEDGEKSKTGTMKFYECTMENENVPYYNRETTV
ncbi:major facilitator superfamily domain-containing protein 6-like isoform X2 [Branchiostoma lanceolatum]|uniref:major facilitator superfamily domain-containing protein 6-like isoform X2 n=1 Tax=Branchiostoma lanceolatum TaxID=7740 RepID=UPI003455DDFD